MVLSLSTLPKSKGTTSRKKRIGRGYGSGKAKTSGKGTKGQSTRGRKETKHGFEGGQVRFLMRMPKKKGFKPLTRITYQVINLAKLNQLASGTTVTAKLVVEKGWVGTTKSPIKILATGTLSVALVIAKSEFSFSVKAVEAIKAAGGSIV